MSGWTGLALILLLLPLGLLSVPLTFHICGRLGPEEQRLEARFAWGWGVLAASAGVNGGKKSFGFRLAGVALPVPRKRQGAVKIKKTGKKAGRKRKARGLNFSAVNRVLNRKLLAAVLSTAKKLFQSLRLRLRLSGVYGTDDPALTGLLAGLAAALHARHFNLDLDADYSGPVFDVDGETSGRVVPIAILWITLRLLLAKPVRKLWWNQLKIKFIRRKTKEDFQNV